MDRRPLQNRVTPEGAIIATPERGLMMGNRGGCLHTPDQRLGTRPWASRQWICCRLEFRGRRRQLMAPGHYTELFFLDEATALAAGHRPCFECRRADALRFAELWALAHAASGAGKGRARAGQIDGILHGQRIARDGTKATHRMPLAALPDGAIVRTRTGPAVVIDGRLAAWTAAGYRDAVARAPDAAPDRAILEVLTPVSIIAVMKLGYLPLLHETARVLR